MSVSIETAGSVLALVAVFSWVVTGEWETSVLITLLVLVAIYGYAHGWLAAASKGLAPIKRLIVAFLRRLLPGTDAPEPTAPYDITIGVDPETRERVIENLADLGHIGVYGITRFGKTTWLHSIIHGLISTHPPSELVLAISDPKTVDYPFYGRLPYLLCPIARDAQETAWMVDKLIAEMNRRITLFSVYANTQICNNIDRYFELSGERLPRVVAVFDELADVVEQGTDLEAKIIRLAKLGLAYGIHLICATQRPSSRVMNGEIKSQFATVLATFMPNSREYGVVALIPKEMYQEMKPIPGRFMVYTPKGQWRFIQGRKVSDRELERVANLRAGRKREWPAYLTGKGLDVAPIQPQVYSLREGTQEEKDRRVLEWLMTLERKPTLVEFRSRFDCSKQTASTYLNRLWSKVQV